MKLQSFRDQGPGGVNPAVVQGWSAFLPGEVSPGACKGDVLLNRVLTIAWFDPMGLPRLA